MIMLSTSNPEKELAYLLAKDFEESWNVSIFDFDSLQSTKQLQQKKEITSQENTQNTQTTENPKGDGKQEESKRGGGRKKPGEVESQRLKDSR